jgi:hypothetical protein
MKDYEKLLMTGQRTSLTPDQMAYIALAVSVTALPEEVKTPVLECEEKIAQLVKSYGDAGLMAIALVGMKLQAEIKDDETH